MLKPYKSAEDYANALSKGTKDSVTTISDEVPYIKAFLAKYMLPIIPCLDPRVLPMVLAL